MFHQRNTSWHGAAELRAGLLGPILGRFFVDYGGRNAYASLMLAVSILSCKLGGLGWLAERCEGKHDGYPRMSHSIYIIYIYDICII